MVARVTPRAIVIHHYDPVWPELFERERPRVAPLLGAASVAIEHVGSTAVPGLAARPCVDMVAGLDDVRAAGPAAIAALVGAGWLDLAATGPPSPGGRALMRPGPQGDAFHLQLVEYGGTDWVDALLFRDYLRRHPRAALAYQQLKHVLADRSADRATYGEGKSGFFTSIMELARLERAAGRL